MVQRVEHLVQKRALELGSSFGFGLRVPIGNKLLLLI